MKQILHGKWKMRFQLRSVVGVSGVYLNELKAKSTQRNEVTVLEYRIEDWQDQNCFSCVSYRILSRGKGNFL